MLRSVPLRPSVACLTVALLAMMFLSAARADDEAAVRFHAQGLEAPASTSPMAVAQRAVLREFLKTHPNYHVEPFLMPSVVGDGPSMDSGPLMAIAAGIPPHAIYVNFRQSSTYLNHGFLEPLEILLARVLSEDERVREVGADGQWLASPTAQQIEQALNLLRDRVPGPAWPVVYRADESGRVPGEHVWALPEDALVIALLYRKDLFKDAGLDPQQPPRTWDELLEYSRRLTVPERQQYGIMLYGGPGLSWGTYSFLVSNGARVVHEEAPGQWVASYDSPEAAEAVHFVWRLINEPFERDGQTIRGVARVGVSELATLWTQGRIAMQFAYLSDQVVDGANAQLIGVAPVPLSPRGTRGSEFNNRMLGVFSGSTPEQKLAVMRYIWFRTGPEARRISTQVYVDLGYGQYVNPNLLEKFGHDRVLRTVPADWKAVFNTAMSAGVPEPYGSNTQNIYSYLTRPMETVLRWPDLHRVPRDEAISRIQRELHASAQDANVRLFDSVPPAVMQKRRVVALVAIAVIGASFAWGAVALWRYFGRVALRPTESGSRQHRLTGYMMLLPALALTLGWMYVPLAWGFGLAFTDYRLAVDSAFVGVDNFAEVLFDVSFWQSLLRTFYYVGLVIGLGFWPPILLAILLDEVPTETLKYLFRTIFYLPAIISGVIIMFLWKQLYDPSAHGALNQLVLSLNAVPPVPATLIKWVIAGLWITFLFNLFALPVRLDEMTRSLKVCLWVVAVTLTVLTVYVTWSAVGLPSLLAGRFHLEPLDWVAAPETAMLCVVLPIVWASAGPGCLLYLAALKTIPSDLYEAADLDGAGSWHKVCYITLPRLKYLLSIQFIAAVIGAFKGGTDYILAMTGGGPQDATMILALQIFLRTFMDLQFGVGAAMAWLLGTLLVGFTAYQLRLLSHAEFASADGKAG